MKRTSSPQDPSDQNPHQSPYYDDDEISLWEIFDTLRARWKIIAAFGIAAPAIALGVTLFIPNQYEARGLVQLAKVGNLQAALQAGGNSQDRGGLSIPVESLPSTLQRLQSDAFALKALSSLGFPSQISGKEPKGTGAARTHRPRIHPGAGQAGSGVRHQEPGRAARAAVREHRP